MDYIDIKIKDKYYIQRTEFSKIIEFDEENKKNNIYSNFCDLPEEVQKEIEYVIDMRNNPKLYFDFIKTNNKYCIFPQENIKAKNIYIPEYIDEIEVCEVTSFPKTVRRNMERLIMPNTVTKVEKNLCADAPLLEEVILSNNLKILPSDCFLNCINLRKINTENLTMLHPYVFWDCEKLESINLENLDTLGAKSLGKTGIKELELPKILYLGDGCLKHSNIEKINLGFGLLVIGNECFKSCRELKEVILPDSLEMIYDRAFENCSSLKEIKWPQHLQTIGYLSFASSGLCGNIHFPEGIESIKGNAFVACNIENASISKNTKVDTCAFSGAKIFRYEPEEITL